MLGLPYYLLLKFHKYLVTPKIILESMLLKFHKYLITFKFILGLSYNVLLEFYKYLITWIFESVKNLTSVKYKLIL